MVREPVLYDNPAKWHGVVLGNYSWGFWVVEVLKFYGKKVNRIHFGNSFHSMFIF